MYFLKKAIFPARIVIHYMHQFIWISTHTYQLLFTVNLNKFFKYNRTRIRLKLELSKKNWNETTCHFVLQQQWQYGRSDMF